MTKRSGEEKDQEIVIPFSYSRGPSGTKLLHLILPLSKPSTVYVTGFYYHENTDRNLYGNKLHDTNTEKNQRLESVWTE